MGARNAAVAYIGTGEVALVDVIAFQQVARQVRTDKFAAFQVGGTEFFMQIF